MRLSFGRIRPVFHLYAKPRMSLRFMARFQGGRPEVGIQQPRVLPRAYVNPKPRVGLFEFMRWPPGRKDKR